MNKARRRVAKRRRVAARRLEDIMSAKHLGCEDRQTIRHFVQAIGSCSLIDVATSDCINGSRIQVLEVAR